MTQHGAASVAPGIIDAIAAAGLVQVCAPQGTDAGAALPALPDTPALAIVPA
ncbi:MAG TPA: hypothetical protein VGI70_08530 [Polyangiales bacterium]